TEGAYVGIWVACSDRSGWSVEEGAVGMGPCLSLQVDGVHVGDASATGQDERGRAGLDRELAQVGGEQDRGAAGARVGDDLEGRLDADRVDAVEGLVEEQYVGLVEGGQNHREPTTHAVREAAGHAV